MATVFVVQETRYMNREGIQVQHNYSDLMRFGPVIFLLPPMRKEIEAMGMTELELLERNLKDYNPKSDYIVFSGDAYLCAMAAMVIYSMTDDSITSINTFKWDRRNLRYVPIVMPIPSTENSTCLTVSSSVSPDTPTPESQP